MSAPFAGVHALPFNSANLPPSAPAPAHDLNAGSRGAAAPAQALPVVLLDARRERRDAALPQGLHAFLRAYYTTRAPTGRTTIRILAGAHRERTRQLPDYYIMDLARDMPDVVRRRCRPPREIAANTWLPERELRVYAASSQRTGSAGRIAVVPLPDRRHVNERRHPALRWPHDRRAVDLHRRPRDWGHYHGPAAMQTEQTRSARMLRGCHFVDGAGHWVQQEQPEEVTRLLLTFLRR
jgi:pimeloyl-ACP methyl ester carboxylesterase